MLGEDRGTSRPATADPAAAAASEEGQAPAPSSRPQSAMSFRPRTASTTGGRSAPASRPRSAASSVGSGNGGRISAQGMRSLSRSMLLEQKQRQQGVDRVTVSRGVQHKPKSARYVPAFPLQPLSSCLEVCCHPRDTLPMTCMGFVLLWLRPPPGPSIDDERGEALDALFFSPVEINSTFASVPQWVRPVLVFKEWMLNQSTYTAMISRSAGANDTITKAAMSSCPIIQKARP